MVIAGKQILNLICFLFLVIINTYAQPKCKVEYYSTEQGLSHQNVTCILKDQEGFMWFGTWDGINRFDGQKFLSYKSSPGDSSQLGNDRIDQIVEGQSGYLWLWAYDREIYRFDKRTGQFTPLSLLITKNSGQKLTFNKILSAANGLLWVESVGQGVFCINEKDLSKGQYVNYKTGGASGYNLPSNSINFFHQDKEGQVWIGTPAGLARLEQSAAEGYNSSKIIPSEIATRINVTAFDEDADALYFSTADGKLITFNKKPNRFHVDKISSSRLNNICRSKIKSVIYATTTGGDLLTFDLKTRQTSSVRYKTGEPLYTLFEDRSGRLWIEPENLGAILLDPTSKVFKYYAQTALESLKHIGNRFRVLEDNNGAVWVNLKGGGFGYYNSDKSIIDNLLTTPDAASYQLPTIAITIYQDKAGILWLTTYDRELVKVILQGNDFKQQLFVQSSAPKSENEVRGISYDNMNRLWMGTKSGKIYVYQGEKKLDDLFENEPPEGQGGVYSILHDRGGNVWLGTKGNGLYKATPTNSERTRYSFTHFKEDNNDPTGLHCNEIYSLLEDRQGRIWIGSFDKGLSLIADDGTSVKFIQSGKAFTNYPKRGYRKIRHMSLDAKGSIWIATTDGLVLLNANDYKYSSYSKVPGDKESVGNNNIQFVYRDAKDRMWLATSGGGLSLAKESGSTNSLKFTNYTTTNGMPNDYLLSCIEDKQGNLWIATENGLSKFNPQSGTFRNYDAYDGLPKLNFSEASVCRQTAGSRIVFGTTKGFLSFDPDNINSNRVAANIVLTNLQINNEDAGPGMNEEVLKANINYVSDLTLAYDQNIISIDYAILDHRAGSRQAFAYRLLGFDTTWHSDRQLRRVTYTNLPPGEYVFEVKSVSTDLYSNNPFKQLRFTILPPPWKTWWAYIIYAFLISVALFFIRRYALAMIRLRNKIVVEQKLAALKLNFFTNVSHELRTPLTLIVNPLEQLAKKENLSSEGASYVDIARKNAARMVRFINQLLDLRKVQSDKATLRVSRVEMVTFTKKIADHFTEEARSNRIKLEVSSNQKEVFAWIDAEKLDVVIYNLLGNALKFTPEGKSIIVKVSSLPDEHQFSIEVHDQGPGVEKENLEKIFELFHEGEILSTDRKGTGIGLALCREFVSLHEGKIWANRNDDGGLTVTVKLKLGSEHFTKENASFVDMPKVPMASEKTIEQQLLTPSFKSNASKTKDAPLVLLVEDNDELRAFLTGQLGEFYQVESARDGQEGYELAVKLIPDLIVSDIMMPVLDGIQLLDKVKNDISTSHIPVVLLSAKYSIESQIEGLKYGADYYITKPFNNEFLIASIDNLLRQRKKLFESLVQKKPKTIELSPEPIVVTSADETFLREVIRVVENKMADPEFNIDLVAESMAMSRTTFYKKFKSLTGMAPVEFVRDMRLQRARQFLDAGTNNVSEVAYSVGFSNPKYFSTCFKEKYHASPSEYQKAKTI